MRAPGSGGAQVRMPTANAGAAVRAPAVSGGAHVTAPSVAAPSGAHITAPTAGATVHAPSAGANINVPGATAPARVSAPAIGGSAALRNPTASGAIAGPNVGAAANAATAAGAHTTLRPNIAGANVGANTATNFRTNWNSLTPAQQQSFRTTFGSAVNAQVAANRAALGLAPARANYWSGVGTNVRNNFLLGNGLYYGGYPYFGGNFFSGRNLIGLGLMSALGGGYGYGPYGIGGYGMGGLGGWWGYSPWLGNQPWNYWYGGTPWNSLAGNYGWNSPYYYDYGPNGNVVYQGNQVLVNDQAVGTTADYAQSAASLAAVTPEEMNAQHDWMPLGTFSVATSQEDTNPVRVAQLAYDNKEGLISGTIFNRESGNLYTIQGKVDPQTQRTAFTIGKDPNVVMETGLYNLTQNETPVLVHFGPTQTATYVFARLPEPDQSQQAATASAPQAPGSIAR